LTDSKVVKAVNKDNELLTGPVFDFIFQVFNASNPGDIFDF
jgi:hypothetical protein